MTTIYNLEPTDDCHVLLAFVQFVMAIISFRFFSKQLKTRQVNEFVSRTVMICDVAPIDCCLQDLFRFSLKNFPTFQSPRSALAMKWRNSQVLTAKGKRPENLRSSVKRLTEKMDLSWWFRPDPSLGSGAASVAGAKISSPQLNSTSKKNSDWPWSVCRRKQK